MGLGHGLVEQELLLPKGKGLTLVEVEYWNGEQSGLVVEGERFEFEELLQDLEIVGLTVILMTQNTDLKLKLDDAGSKAQPE